MKVRASTIEAEKYLSKNYLCPPKTDERTELRTENNEIETTKPVPIVLIEQQN